MLVQHHQLVPFLHKIHREMLFLSRRCMINTLSQLHVVSVKHQPHISDSRIYIFLETDSGRGSDSAQKIQNDAKPKPPENVAHIRQKIHTTIIDTSTRFLQFLSLRCGDARKGSASIHSTVCCLQMLRFSFFGPTVSRSCGVLLILHRINTTNVSLLSSSLALERQYRNCANS